ncbi:DUF308 domain-containing protein [Allosaccharopolyspora coralli]|uniref:DUF308 domain-containing protein n=1 Tax=Allosaccharopolyspora coralli TaxID=2665642 RepID=A0A5Q3Q485_9PSEU|nr:DUF308 domain-containing protein [Allosaccharopolyspora coralli]QGK69428.1 DUF308 domain-containing protein [Allosaccharopolyspora coralli]
MSTRRDSADGPEDIDARFAEIVAGLERDAPLGQWPDGSDTRAVDRFDSEGGNSTEAGARSADPAKGDTANPDSRRDSTNTDSTSPDSTSTDSTAAVNPSAEGTGPRDWQPGPETEDDEGHFEPPEPPPITPPQPSTWGGIGLIVLGVVMLVVPGLLGSVSTVALPLGLVSISGGIAWLLLRLRHTPPQDSDDGAQL